MYLATFFTLIFSCSTLGVNLEKPDDTHRYTIYFFLLDECKICRDYGPELKRLSDEFESEIISFVGVFPNFSSKSENIEKFKSEFDIPFELKTDYFKKLSHKFGAKILPEVFVYDHDLDKVIYSGRIDDRYAAIGKRKRVIRKFDLRDVLDNIKSGDTIITTRTEPIGCFINFNDNL